MSVFLHFIQFSFQQKTLQPALVLSLSCVPEKVSANQKKRK